MSLSLVNIPMSTVDFKKCPGRYNLYVVSCCLCTFFVLSLSLSPKNSCVALSILEVHTHKVVLGRARGLILGDDVLLYIAYVVFIWAPVIPAPSCSQQSVLVLSAGGRLQLHLVAGMRGAQIRITGLV